MEAIGPLHGLHVGERNKTSLGQRGGRGSFGPWPYFRVKTFSNFQTNFQFANYFEFN
jgi:hypothetical protein